MTRTITALFDTTEQAERAAHDLATRVGGVRGEVYGADRAGEFSSLAVPDEDRAVLHENVRRGGAVLHAEVPDEKFEAVADALEAAGAADFEEREAAWRKEGWTGAPAAAGTAGAGTGTPVVTGDDTAATATTDTAAAASGTARQEAAATGGEEVIPVVEERLRVGKRETAHGRVRVRSYVVETPVQEQVRLREERVQVERRPVDRPVGAADDALFRERTIEATESAEEAVVSKEARVVEEVVVRKEAEERTETVEDTVRRTEVEVEDERGRTAGAPGRRGGS
jgi:uncharacterized protein (TIGR02271 family)